MNLNDSEIQKITEHFWSEGYAVIENFFDTELMDRLNSLVLDNFGLDPKWEHTEAFLKKSETEVIPWFPFREGHTDFAPIEQNSALKELTTGILETGWQGLYLMAMFSPKGTKGQAWHQDCPPENPDHFNLNRLVYPHDITPETGGYIVVRPKSHRIGVLPQGEPHGFIDKQVELIPKKGTIILVHGHTWHRVLPIIGAYRVSINSRAIPINTPEDVTDIAIYRNMRYRFSTNEIIEER